MFQFTALRTMVGWLEFNRAFNTI